MNKKSEVIKKAISRGKRVGDKGERKQKIKNQTCPLQQKGHKEFIHQKAAQVIFITLLGYLKICLFFAISGFIVCIKTDK